MDGQLSLELPDAPLGRGQLVPLWGAQAWRQAAIDLILPPPEVDGLITDPEIPGHIRDLAPGHDQVHDPPPELC
jgi:hypothetical protein